MFGAISNIHIEYITPYEIYNQMDNQFKWAKNLDHKRLENVLDLEYTTFLVQSFYSIIKTDFKKIM